MTNYMLVRHKVRDFAVWKRGYDSHRAKREETGLTEKYLLRETNDPNEIIILFEARDLDQAAAFAESADLRETMEKFGVVDKPNINFLTD